MAVGLPVPVAVLVAVPVAVLVAVGLPVPVAVLVAVAVPVAVFVADPLRLAVGCTDFDGDAFGVGTRLTLGGAELTALPGCVPLAEGLGRWVDAAGGVIVVLLAGMPPGVAPLLFDSSSATIAMTPIAAAPIPA